MLNVAKTLVKDSWEGPIGETIGIIFEDGSMVFRPKWWASATLLKSHVRPLILSCRPIYLLCILNNSCSVCVLSVFCCPALPF